MSGQQEKTNPGSGINYTNYPFLHAEDFQGKIRELGRVIPPYFRADSILDVRCDAAIITRAIGETHGARIVHGLEVSEPAIDLIRRQLSVFQDGRAIQQEFEGYKSDRVYDLTMFIDVLEHLEDPLSALRKASEISRYAAIRCPLEETKMNVINKSLLGKDYKKIMEGRHGPVHHFNMDALGSLIEEGGFDVVKGENFRVPGQAEILANPLQGNLERMTWNMARRSYPDMWGGFYVAFCKSRNYRVLDPEAQAILITVLGEEFGNDNLMSLGLFGSIAQDTHRRFSDYDFAVILREASNDTYERETASPRLKRRLRERGLTGLYAFNIYTQTEFDAADSLDSWIIETMRNGNRIIFDSDHYLADRVSGRKDSVRQVSMFAWEGIKTESVDRFESVTERHGQVAGRIEDISPELANYHRGESRRGEFISRLFKHGVYMTRGSILDLAKKLVRDFGEEIDLDSVAIENYQHEMENIPAIYRYNQIDIHLQVADVLRQKGFPLDALFHTYAALRNAYTQVLHNADIYASDGEITQLFVKEFGQKIPTEILELIYKNSFKAEQILGRSGYTSFDINEEGKPIYEGEGIEFDYVGLMDNVRDIIIGLKSVNLVTETTTDSPKVSIVIASYNRFGYLAECIKSLDRLIIPRQKVEIVIIDDGSNQEYNVDGLRELTDFDIRYVKKEHSGICATKNRGVEESKGEYVAFLDDDMEASPLWLVRLLSGFRDERIAGVGSTNLTIPDTHYLTKYSDYRELIRRPFRDEMGEILNVITGSACIRKDILIEAGGFNRRQSEQGVPFGGDDVDLTYAIRNLGYLFNYSDNAYAFHNHRRSLRSFVNQHLGYGEGTMFHCIDTGRDPSDLGIPEPTYQAVALDLARYLATEVPKRMVSCYGDNLGIQKSLIYPLLDFSRRLFYDIGILKARRFVK